MNVAGFSRRNHCTGALVAADKVLTAAHCLRRKNGAPARNADIHFLPGADRGAYVAHGRAKCVVFLPGAPGLGNDAALIHLREAAPIAPLAIREGGPLRQGALVSLAGYPRRAPHKLRLEENCRIIKRSKALLVSDCKAEPGVSGGPMLTTGAGGAPEIAAIAVAVTKRAETLALPAARWRALLNASCPAETGAALSR